MWVLFDVSVDRHIGTPPALLLVWHDFSVCDEAPDDAVEEAAATAADDVLLVVLGLDRRNLGGGKLQHGC